MSQKTKVKKSKKKDELRDIRRNNAKLYPIYKMFSWDFLFFYSIEFLFLTITKKLDASQILVISGFYLIFKIIGQLPAVVITDFLGKRKSIILGNVLLIFDMLTLMFFPGAISVVIANLFCALGFDMKNISESNLLYDSVSTKGGEGLFSKLDAKGGSWYYLLDGIASLAAGYLFVINNYLPLVICLGFVIISTILSFKFKDIYEVSNDKKQEISLAKTVKEYAKDLKVCFKFILKSGRMKSFILFQVVFYSLIRVIDTYRSQLLTDLLVPEEQFSMIIAALTLIGGISLTLKKSIEKKFKNKTLTFISLMYIGACIVVGTISSLTLSKNIIPLILIMYAVMKMSTSTYWILESKYLKNFTNENMRNKLTFTFEFIGAVSASIFSMLGGLLLKVVNVENAFLMVGLLALACMVVTLDYMRKRFGLRPKQYKKEDIEF